MKKKRTHFTVPNYGAKNRKGVKERWRHQRGIDNKKRVMKSGYGALPRIGYKGSEALRHRLRDGTLPLLVHNAAELHSAAGMNNVSVVLHHALSKRKRLALQKMAEQRNLRVLNRVL